MMDVSSMDIESMMMAVQSNRANLLEAQLMSEMKNVQAKNVEMARLNGQLSTLTSASQKSYGTSDPKADTGLSAEQKADLAKIQVANPRPEMTAAEKKVVADKWLVDNPAKPAVRILNQDLNAAYNNSRQASATAAGEAANDAIKKSNGAFSDIKNKGELDSAVTKLKSQVDSMGSTQQMDMLRLQSLSNKRNEAFDLMTNFMKKFADKRESIVGNMR
jgi:hypothetical protein